MSVKKIIVDGVEHQIDYNALENLPDLAAIMPKYAHFTVAEEDKEKIKKVYIHKYACPERFDDEPEGYKVDNDKITQAVIMARDGDFGYHAIDGTGQVNFTVEFNSAYKTGYVVLPVITNTDGSEVPAYSNFKSKYSTGLNCPLGTVLGPDFYGLVTDGIYRITKITKDINVELHVVKEADLPAHTVTYNLINPDNVDAVVTTYRCVDGIEKIYKYGVYDSAQAISAENPKNGYPKEFQNVLTFSGGAAVDYTYDKGSGFRSNATLAEGSAALQFTVTNLPEGYKATADISGTQGTDHNGLEYTEDYGGYFKGKKIAGNVIVTITISDAVGVTYNSPIDAYQFGDGNLASASKRSDFTFDIYYNLDKTNNNSDHHTLLPNPATLLDRIASITSNGVALVAGEDYFINAVQYSPDADNVKWQSYKDASKNTWYILSDGTTVSALEATEEQLALRVPSYISGLSGKKATITIDHTKITGDIVITTAIPANA